MDYSTSAIEYNLGMNNTYLIPSSTLSSISNAMSTLDSSELEVLKLFLIFMSLYVDIILDLYYYHYAIENIIWHTDLSRFDF